MLPSGHYALHHRLGNGCVVVMVVPIEGVMWRHATMTRRGRAPSYEDVQDLRRAVFGIGWAYQPFPPQPSHATTHRHSVHLWGRADGLRCMPNFGAGGVTPNVDRVSEVDPAAGRIGRRWTEKRNPNT
jgi:hypothetical protein